MEGHMDVYINFNVGFRFIFWAGSVLSDVMLCHWAKFVKIDNLKLN
jgi:hypothetical protein